jgi:hypothetical protein
VQYNVEIGFIKVHRKLIEWQWYKDINVCRLFIHLLITANYIEKPWLDITVKRGQKPTSIQSLSNETSLTPKQVRTALSKLKSSKDVAIITTSKYSLITLVNYDKYQDKPEQEGKQKDKRRASRGQTKGNN